MKYYSVNTNPVAIREIKSPILYTVEYEFVIIVDYPYFEVIPTLLALRTINDSMIIDLIHYIKSVVVL